MFGVYSEIKIIKNIKKMKAEVKSLHVLLDGMKQFKTPIYQRNYTWNTTECETLLNDILSEKTTHHVGSIVYKESGPTFSGNVQTNLLIDGQQRITTISLLFKAIIDFLKTNEDKYDFSIEQIKETYLINRHGKKEQKNKLFINSKDNDNYNKLLNDYIDLVDKNSKIYKNYKFLLENINEDNIEKIYNGIKKLYVIEAILGEYDDPQQIFESLNSTGMDLTQSDLIRNFILMSLSDEIQTDLYYNYWSKMEEIHNENSESLTNFIRNYIECKRLTSTKEKEVYSDYKIYAYNQNVSRQLLLEDMFKFSGYYTQIFKEKEKNTKLNKLFSDFTKLKIGYVEPILLFLYNDFDKKILNENDFETILQTLLSYLIRRNVVISASRDMEPLFFNIMKKITDDKTKDGFSSDDYKNRILSELLLLKDIKRFPTDTEFRDSFLSKDIYNSKHKVFILEKIENYGRKEKISIDKEKLTIEHIIPQNEDIPECWKNELGSDYDNIKTKYLHTICNLTITGLNSEMSDKCFGDKKIIGFNDSPYQINKFVRDQDKWNQDTMINRLDTYLFPIMSNIWAFPNIDFETLKKYKDEMSKYKIDKYEYYKEHKDLYELFCKKMRNNDILLNEKNLANSIDFDNIFSLRFQKKEIKLYFTKNNDIINILDNIDETNLDRDIKKDEIVISLNDEKNIDYILNILNILLSEK